MNGASCRRNLPAFLALRSITYSVPPNPNRTRRCERFPLQSRKPLQGKLPQARARCTGNARFARRGTLRTSPTNASRSRLSACDDAPLEHRRQGDEPPQPPIAADMLNDLTIASPTRIGAPAFRFSRRVSSSVTSPPRSSGEQAAAVMCCTLISPMAGCAVPELADPTVLRYL